MSKILVIAPHPDDEIIGCGGTIIKLVRTGHLVDVLYLSSGDSNQKTREAEAKAVSKLLGLHKIHFMRLKDKNFAINGKNINKLKALLSKVSPDYVYANHERDGDREHKIAYQLITEAYWRFNQEKDNKKISGIVLYEVHTSMDKYSVVEDISSVIKKKIGALRLYKSQLKLSDLDKAVKGLNRYRGSIHESCDYAEVFQIKKFVDLSDLLKK